MTKFVNLCPPSWATITTSGFSYYHQPEFDDVYKVFEAGAAKHGDLNFLEANGSRCSHKDMHDSMFHHLAQSYAGNRLDKETQLDHLLHLITRGMIAYTRIQRGLEHKDDHK